MGVSTQNEKCAQKLWKWKNGKMEKWEKPKRLKEILIMY